MPQSSIEHQAMERVKRMYGGFDAKSAPQKPAPVSNEEPPRTDPSPAPVPNDANLLDELLKDNERSMLLLLLLVLYSEKADASLLLSLLYLIL